MPRPRPSVLSAFLALALLACAPAFAAPPPAPVARRVVEKEPFSQADADRKLAALQPFLGDWETVDERSPHYLRIAPMAGVSRIIMVGGYGRIADAGDGAHHRPALIGYDFGGYRIQLVTYPMEFVIECDDRPWVDDLSYDGKSTITWDECIPDFRTRPGSDVLEKYDRIGRSTLTVSGDRLVSTFEHCDRGKACDYKVETRYVRVAPAGDFGFRPKR